jgi:hypothetical protein
MSVYRAMRTHRIRTVTTACSGGAALLCLALAAGPGHATAEPPPARSGFALEGRFVQVDKDADHASIEAGIERVAQALSPLVRPVLRPYLRTVTRYCPLPVFHMEDSTLSYACGGTPIFTSAVDGQPFDWQALQGDATYTVSQALVADDLLVQTFANDMGGREQTFELQPDGRTLLSRVTYDSELLPVPFSFVLRYQRVD